MRCNVHISYIQPPTLRREGLRAHHLISRWLQGVPLWAISALPNRPYLTIYPTNDDDSCTTRKPLSSSIVEAYKRGKLRLFFQSTQLERGLECQQQAQIESQLARWIANLTYTKKMCDVNQITNYNNFHTVGIRIEYYIHQSQSSLIQQHIHSSPTAHNKKRMK